MAAGDSLLPSPEEAAPHQALCSGRQGALGPAKSLGMTLDVSCAQLPPHTTRPDATPHTPPPHKPVSSLPLET